MQGSPERAAANEQQGGCEVRAEPGCVSSWPGGTFAAGRAGGRLPHPASSANLHIAGRSTTSKLENAIVNQNESYLGSTAEQHQQLIRWPLARPRHAPVLGNLLDLGWPGSAPFMQLLCRVGFSQEAR